MPIVSGPGAAAAAPNELRTIRNLNVRGWTWPPSSVPRSDPIHPLFALRETWVPDSKALRLPRQATMPCGTGACVTLSGAPQDDPRRHLAFAALAPLSILCSEAAAERLFSTLEWLLDSRRLPLSIDVLSNEGSFACGRYILTR
jgi:hypothetical protein